MTGHQDVGWPSLPYLGLRRFEASDQLLYGGRERDLRICLQRLNSVAIRVLVLQGLSGSGKSSFLRAGLLPKLEILNDQPIVPICTVIPAGLKMFEAIAHQVYEYVIQGGGRHLWPQDVEVLKTRYPDLKEFVKQVAANVEVLIDFLSELSNCTWRSALIAIDQVEYLWLMPPSPESEAVRKKFLRLVYEFALERLNGKLVLAIRTEQYGVFASGLPDSTVPAIAELSGVNRLCHHYLANPSRDELVALVKHPAGQYNFSFEDKLPELIVKEVQKLAQQPEMSVLPLLQVVLTRLYIEGRRDAGSAAFTITHMAFSALLQAADMSTIGLLDDFVRWGVGRAVGLAFEPESSSDPLLSRGIEVSRWLTVLKEMSTVRMGSRVLVRKNLDEIERSAKTNECEAVAPRMIEYLVDPEIALLARLDSAGDYALRHDLICLTFDRATDSPVPEFSEQTVHVRKGRINKAAEYGLQDLFGDDPPAPQKLRVAELRFWDHKLLAYAVHAKFFQRLGFDVESVECADNVSATELVARLTDGQRYHAVYSFPRTLMKSEEQLANQDVVVLNSFTGYAVICNAAAGLPRLQDDVSWEGFETSIGALLALLSQNAVYLFEDQGAEEFFASIMDIAQQRKREQWQVTTHAAIEAMLSLIRPANVAGPAILERMLGERLPCVAVVTAPTWATAGMVGGMITTVLDHRSVLGLIDRVPDAARPAYADVRRELSVRNVMNIHLASYIDQAEIEPLLMRLASIGLFLAEFVWASESLVGEWIRRRWNESEQCLHNRSIRMSAPAFQRTFRRSYHYTPANEHGDLYFGAEWPNDCAGALAIHHKLILAWMAYQKQTDLLVTSEASVRVPEHIRVLVERAHRHAEISNYYDARRLLDHAMQLLNLQVPSG